MDEIDTTNPVEGEAMPLAEVFEDAELPGATPLASPAAAAVYGAADKAPPTPTSSGRTDEGEGATGDPDDASADLQQEEELEEIERDGRRAKIPAWLKPELMMQADYTRKTQELAEARRAFEAERGEVQQFSEAERSAQSSLAIIDSQIDRFSTADWNAWHDSDPFGAQKAFAQFQLLKDARKETLGYLDVLSGERMVKAQQETAKRYDEAAAELARDIKDWSPQMAAKLFDFGQRHFGFSAEDMHDVDDPRAIKVLHAACQWEEHQAKQRQAQRHAAAQTARPAARVGGASPRPGLDDRLSAEEWTRRRNEQLRKRRG